MNAGLADLQRWAAARGVPLHTVQVTVDGETRLEATGSSFDLHTPQRMYSVTKSLTGLAVGLLVADGAVALDDRVVTHFPDAGPVHPFVAATTIRDLLTMRGPHASTTYKRHAGPWLESWFRVAPAHRPGTLFTYDTSGSYVLAALVERTTGESLPAFLRPRLLEPLGLSPGLRVLTGPDGYSSGGSGLICTPDDLRRVAELVVAGGVWEGEALMDPDFLRAATSPWSDTSAQTWGEQLRGGYGYQFWTPRGGGWLMFGMGGQLVHGDPHHGLVVVVTADTQSFPGGDQSLLDLVLGRLVPGWRCVRPSAPVSLERPRPAHDPAHGRVERGRWRAEPTCASALQALELDVDDDQGVLRALDGDEGTPVWTLPFGLGRATRVERCPVAASAGLPGPAVVSAGWSAPGTLDLRVDAVGDELGALRIRLVWDAEGWLTVRRVAFGESVPDAWSGSASYRLSP